MFMLSYNRCMSILQEFLIKSAGMENDLLGLGAGGVLGSLGGLYAGNRITMQKLKPHIQFVNSVADASRKNADDLIKIVNSKNFDDLASFTQLLRKDPVEAAKYIANVTDSRVYSSIRESIRDLDRPNITQEALDDAKRRIQNMARYMSANKLASIYSAAKQLGVPKEHTDTLMNAIKYSGRADRLYKILNPALRRMRGIGLLSGLLAGSGAGLGISRLISD